MIHQGHLYLLRRQTGPQRVLALQNHPTGIGSVRCMRIEPASVSGMGPTFYARADELEPLPMKYFGGIVPFSNEPALAPTPQTTAPQTTAPRTTITYKRRKLK